MSEPEVRPVGSQPWLVRALAAVALGALGGCLGFVAGFAVAVALLQNSSAGVAGGGDGVDALVAACFLAGVAGALVGGFSGVWLSLRFGRKAEPSAPANRGGS